MNNDEIIPLTQRCIVNSESKLDSAQILAKNGKFEDAIILIIIAYEEAGKADFLINKITNKETVSDGEWKKLTRGGSHETKLVMCYENTKKLFEAISDSYFTDLLTSLNKKPPEVSRNQMLKGLQNKIEFFKKLNDLKKNITYVDNKLKNKELTKNELDDIFSFLDFETRTSISSTKLSLDFDSFVPTGNGLEDVKEIDKLDSYKDCLDLQNESVIPSNAQKFTLAQSLLEKM